jgi:protein-S-isoprenylcysteine O-methyltransferase Ste14
MSTAETDDVDRAADPGRDSPGVVVLPPLLYGAAFIALLVLRWLWPMPILGARNALWSGLVLLVLGAALAVAGRRALTAAGTNVNPSLPATVLVTSGLYRRSRNPLYVALTLFYLGLTALANTWWGIVLLAPVLIVMHVGVVLREERYLERKFGDAYRQYRSRVRRYF